MKSIYDIDFLIPVIRELQKDEKKIVFTNGCFDLFHIGHLDILRQSKSLGDFLIVGLNSDLSIKRLKGIGRPIMSESHRFEIVKSIGCVDSVLLFNEDTPLKLIMNIKPDILTKGSDWSDKFSFNSIVGSDFVESYGGKVVTISRNIKISTTDIIAKIIQSLETNE